MPFTKVIKDSLAESHVIADMRDSLRHFRNQQADAKQLILASLISGFGSVLSGFILVLYVNQFAGGTVAFGSIMLVSGVANIMVLMFSGLLGDWVGHKPVLLLAGVLAICGTALYASFTSLQIFFAAAALGGASGGLAGPATNALLAEKSSTSESKYVFSYASFVGTLAGAAGNLIGGMIPMIFSRFMDFGPVRNYQMVFYFAVVFQAIGWLLLLRVPEEPHCHVARAVTSGERKSAWRWIAMFALPQAVIGFGAGFVIPYFQVFFELRFGVSVEVIAVAFMFNSLVMAAALLLIPKAAERLGSMHATMATQIGAIVLLVIIPFVPPPHYWLCVVLFIARMVLMNVSGPIITAYMMQKVPTHARGTATSMTMIAWISSNSLGMFFGGFMWNGASAGYVPQFIICTSLYIAATCLYASFFLKADDKAPAAS
ncbi:MAG: MFS transporter [Methanobacteriota archaeon]